MLIQPDQFDWRKENIMFPIRNMGECDSPAFVVVDNVQGVWMVSHKYTVDDFSELSVQQILDCSGVSCNGGELLTVYNYIIMNGGLVPEQNFSTGACVIDPDIIAACISKVESIDSSEDAMRDTLVSVGPIVIEVDSSQWQFYNGGIYPAQGCGTDLDHVVLGVGYDITGSSPFWILRNYWGVDWGENGYMRLEYGKNACGLSGHPLTGISKMTCP